jgi:hypothetical protein
MIFDRSHRDRWKLERELHREKPEPSVDLTERIVRNVADAAVGVGHGSGRRLRLVAGLTLTVLLLVAIAATGGIGHAQTAVTHTTSAAVSAVKDVVGGKPQPTVSPDSGSVPNSSSGSTAGSGFAAALAVYPAPILTCAFDWNGAARNKFKITGTTSVAVGTISVTVTESPDGPSYPSTQGPFAATATWTTPAYFPDTTNGRTYTATVTQTATDYDPGTCTVSDTP